MLEFVPCLISDLFLGCLRVDCMTRRGYRRGSYLLGAAALSLWTPLRILSAMVKRSSQVATYAVGAARASAWTHLDC